MSMQCNHGSLFFLFVCCCVFFFFFNNAIFQGFDWIGMWPSKNVHTSEILQMLTAQRRVLSHTHTPTPIHTHTHTQCPRWRGSAPPFTVCFHFHVESRRRSAVTSCPAVWGQEQRNEKVQITHTHTRHCLRHSTQRKKKKKGIFYFRIREMYDVNTKHFWRICTEWRKQTDSSHCDRTRC